MRKRVDWADENLSLICARQAYDLKLPDLDLFALDSVFNRRDNAYDWHYSGLNDYRHQQYFMEKANSKRKSSDSVRSTGSASSISLSASVPEDLRIATPDDSPTPQIKKRKETIADLAERMRGFITDVQKAHEDLKAAHEEVRLIAKAAEETNERLFSQMTNLTGRISFIEKQLGNQDGNIEDVKRELLRSSTRLDAIEKRGQAKAPPSVPIVTTTRPVGAPIPGTVVPASAKPLPTKNSPTRSFPALKRAEEHLTEEDFEGFDDPYCARCNTDYKKGAKHVCA